MRRALNPNRHGLLSLAFHPGKLLLHLAPPLGDGHVRLTDPTPWDSTNWYVKMGPDAGTGNSVIETYFWEKRFHSSDGVTFTAHMPGTAPRGTIYKKDPYMYEKDPVTGPMNWQVAVIYDE